MDEPTPDRAAASNLLHSLQALRTGTADLLHRYHVHEFDESGGAVASRGSTPTWVPVWVRARVNRARRRRADSLGGSSRSGRVRGPAVRAPSEPIATTMFASARHAQAGLAGPR